MGSSRVAVLCQCRGLRLLAVCFVIACNLLNGFAFRQYTEEPHGMSPEQLREFMLKSLLESNVAADNSAALEQIPTSDDVNEHFQQTSDSEYLPDNSDADLSPEALTAFTDEQKLDSEGSAIETLVLDDGASTQQQEDGETLPDNALVDDESQNPALPPTVPADFIQEAADILIEELGNGVSEDEKEVEDSSLVHSGTDNRRLGEAEDDTESAVLTADEDDIPGSTGEVVESTGSEEEEVSGILQDSTHAEVPLEGTQEEAEQQSVDEATNARRLSSEQDVDGEELASETATEHHGEEVTRESEPIQSFHTGPESPVNAIPVDVSEDSEQTVTEELDESQPGTASGRRLAVDDTTQECDDSEGADGAASVVGQTAEDENAVTDNQEVHLEEKSAQEETEEQSKESSESSPTTANLRRLHANEGEPSEAVQVEESYAGDEEDDPANSVTDDSSTAGVLPSPKASLRGATGTNVQDSPSDAPVVDSDVAYEMQGGSEDGEEGSASS